MPSRSTRTAGIVLAVLGVVAVVVAIVFLVRPAGPDASPAASSPSASAAPDTSAPATSAPATAATTESSATAASSSAAPDPGAASTTAASDAPPAASAPTVFSFAAASVDCAGDRAATVPVSLSWETSGGVSARLAIGTTDAADGTPVALAASAYSAVSVDCRDSETLITLAVLSAAGTLTQRTLIIQTPSPPPL